MLQLKLLVILSIIFAAVHCSILPGHDERRTSVQQSGSQCILHVAQSHFGIGSTTAIVQSGLPTKIHFNGVLSSYTMMLSTFMAALKWTVVVNQADTYKGLVLLATAASYLSPCLLTYISRNLLPIE